MPLDASLPFLAYLIQVWVLSALVVVRIAIAPLYVRGAWWLDYISGVAHALPFARRDFYIRGDRRGAGGAGTATLPLGLASSSRRRVHTRNHTSD